MRHNIQDTKRKQISVVIPTYNCESTIQSCLKSCEWADEIIVIDMGSTDSTLNIANKYNTKIIARCPSDRNFDKNRKFGMEIAKSNWILKLDSDEELSEELQVEIKRAVNNPSKSSVNGYNLKNKIYMFGKQVKHGFVKSNSHELRLVRNGAWEYNPYKFHEQIKIKGNTQTLNGYYSHQNYKDVSEFFQKTNLYTSLDSKVMSLTTRISPIDIIISPIKTFIKLYFMQSGLLDGMLGVETSFLFSVYGIVGKIKIYEINSKKI